MVTASLRADRAAPIYTGLFVVLAVLIALAAFSGALSNLVARWHQQEEYSHGFLIPLIAAWMLWARRDALFATVRRPSWSGPLLILLAAIMHIVGELSAFFLLSQLAFILALYGIVLAVGGLPLLRICFIPITFLVFAFPLPYFIDSQLSFQLQLVSSKLGVFFLRLVQIPVYLEGNIIDLGRFKLEVAEACSGLRYLYPLLSLGFLAAYLFQASLWKRALVFLSAIPITIVMNSFRIAMIGVLVDRWGPSMAEGATHFFEGWVIFIACAALLGLEIALLALIGDRKRFFQVFYLPKIEPVVRSQRYRGSFTDSLAGPAAPWPMLGCLLLLCVAGVLVFTISGRQELIPERQRFVAFPTDLDGWQGHPSSLELQVEHALGLDDYILSDYTRPDGRPVNLYVAYYPTQRKGSSPHSPIVCIPGGGWQIIDIQRTAYSNNALKLSLPFNRVVIGKDSNKDLVYYWFVERGRTVANEYWAKWYLLVDAIIQNRSDAALIRLTTPIYPGESEQAADGRLQSFIEALQPRLTSYLPPETKPIIKSVRTPFDNTHS